MLFQSLADGLLTGAIISLGAIGLNLTMGTLRFPNFAHAELLTFGAYVAWGIVWLTGTFAEPIGPLSFGLPLMLGTLVAIVATTFLAIGIDRLVFAKLRTYKNRMAVVFGSFGVSLLVRMLVLLAFGGTARYYSDSLQMAISVGGLFRIMPDQVFTLCFTLVVVLALQVFLMRTNLGLAMRAYAENSQLVSVNGFDAARVVRWTWIIGASLAAVAGVLYGVTVQIRPEMGFQLLLPLFAAAILGGIGSVPGAAAGGLIVGLCQSLSVFILPPGYKMAVPFLLLVLILYIRPSGLFGLPQGSAK